MKKFVIIQILLCCFTFNVLAQNAIPPASGDGSSGNPYTIGSLGNLYWISSQVANWDKHYIQISDIDASSTELWFNNQGWVAIGTVSDKFTGSYNGQGYGIDGLFLHYANLSYQGLFGYVLNATLKNINLTNISVSGNGRIGGLSGTVSNSFIDNVSVSGTISGLSIYTGGVFGVLSGGLVHRVHADVTVEGANNTGGIAGYITTSAELRHCYSIGSVSGNNDVGGIAGELMNGMQFITDSYSHASVTGENRVGGFVGHLWAGTVYRSFSTGQVTGTGINVGGLIGQGNGFVYNSYWDIGTSGQPTSAGGGPGPVGKTTAQMSMQSTFKYYNFNTLWKIDNAYPTFRNLSDYSPLEIADIADLSGSGTANAPYLIHNANELAAMHQDLEAHYQLANNIDLSASVIWNYGKGWLPVGTSTSGFRFKGSLDGNGFTLADMTVNIPNGNNMGLFGYLEQALIENLVVSNANVQSDQSAGILAGSILGSDLLEIEVSGIITSRTSVGGLAGTLNNTQASRIKVNSLIKGGNRAGGIAGIMTNGGELRFATSLGEVIGEDYVGGLVGEMSTGSPQVSDCYSRADTEGADRVGGLIGFIWSGAVNNAYSAGLVQGTGSNVGGLVGQGVNAMNSFWDIETSGQTASAAGEGKTTSEMKTESTFTDAGWDFVEIWTIDENYNDGYPLFNWQTLVSYSEIISGIGVRVFPNPSKGFFEIQFNEVFPSIQVVVYDATGKVVYHQSFVSTQHIPVSINSYKPGLHFIRIDTGLSGQIIKMLLF